jgi:cyclin-C
MGGNPRNSSRSSFGQYKKVTQDVVGFMAGLNVNMEVIASIAQEILSICTLWERYQEEATESAARGSFAADQSSAFAASLKWSVGTRSSGSVASTSMAQSPSSDSPSLRRARQPASITPTSLTQLLFRMRESKMADMAHPPTGRPMALDKRLERTQNA